MPEYYQNNHTDYYKRTGSVDPSSFLSPFVKSIPKDCSILDIGCGSGRDLLWLKNQGFQLTGFELSKGLAELASIHSGCEVIEGDFETYDFSRLSFDAILASGSLVHVPHSRLYDVLLNIKQAIVEGGFFYVSLKEGENTYQDKAGRIFYLWEDSDLRPLFSKLNFKVLHFSTSLSVLNSKDPWLGYVLKAE
jgi:SAM-dependent methyltransferase